MAFVITVTLADEEPVVDPTITSGIGALLTINGNPDTGADKNLYFAIREDNGLLGLYETNADGDELGDLVRAFN
jgi:hypothetical protein